MSLISSNNIKRLKLTALILLSPLIFFAQSLTGLWTGALSNDSNTVRKDQSFEIALTEYKGKVYGYSCSEFIVDDELFYIVKRVKGTIVGDMCEVTDDEIIAYNFKGKLDKNVKVTSTFRRNGSDSAWHLDGTWKTNVTKKYYAVTGKVGLKEEKDMAMSKLFPHLEELNMANDVAFYKEKKDAPVIVKIAKPERIRSEYTDKPLSLSSTPDVALTPDKPNTKIETEQALVKVNKRGDELNRPETKNIPSSSVDLTPSAVNKTIAESDISSVFVRKQDVETEKTGTKTIPSSSVDLVPASVNKTIAESDISSVSVRKQDNIAQQKTGTKNLASSSVDVAPSSVNKSLAETKIPVATTNSSTSVAVNNKPVINKTETKTNNPVVSAPTNKTTTKQDQPVVKTQQPATQPDVVATKPETKTNTTANNSAVNSSSIASVEKKVERKTDAELTKPVATIGGRKSEFSQVVNFKSDSLELALYDNGEIDGDTVSVFMNGEVIMAKQGLRSKAIKKTIYITKGNEDFTLVLFADNLGKYPPNTGLLVVHDGDDVYNLRFSSDMQKSSGIVFRKKQ